MQTTAIQSALLARGFDLGPAKADGIWGRASISALRDFQFSQHIMPTGVPDTPTLQALFGQRTVPLRPDPVWYGEASRLKGLHENTGASSNPVILDWAKALGGWVRGVYTDDATPWCGLFVAHCIATTLPRELLPSNPLSALAWAKFGVALAKPSLGAVCVFSRKGGGHVAFYAGEDDTTVHVLGGNQSDAVTVTRVLKTRLVGYRWPTTAPLPTGGPTVLAGGGAVSRNEA